MKIDAIIIGQGIAGTALAFQLRKNNKSFVIIDPNQNNASKVAAGLINPLVYKRVTKSWMADTLIPYAHQFYNEISEELNAEMLFHVPIIKLFNDEAHIKVWENKHHKNMQEYTSLMPFDYSRYGFKNVVGGRTTLKTGFLDTKTYLKAAKTLFEKEKNFLEAEFNFNDLEILEHGVKYQNLEADKIFFCQGHHGAYNPFFKYLPFTLTKGEGIDIKMKSNIDQIFTKGFFIKPQGQDLFKVGSTFNWEDKTTTPTPAARIAMENKIKDLIDTPYEVVNHWAGIRPTVKDRRPLIGQHPEHPSLFIFNGLGTKGVMIAPYFSQELFAFAYLCQDLNEEVDIKRF